MLVVAFAIAGRVDINLLDEPISYDPNQEPVYLKDIWPSDDEINEIMSAVLSPDQFEHNYSTIFDGNDIWKNLEVPKEKVYQWDPNSTYIKEVPFFKDLPEHPAALHDIHQARVLLNLGDSITTDHISPAGAFKETVEAGKYLLAQGVKKEDFNSYGSRRGNDEIMIRGTFANVRIKNKLATQEGGFTTYFPEQEERSIYAAAMGYKELNTPLIILAGKEYGSGSSRDWAAKGTFLLGVKAVIAESYERIHRSNLVGMGVLPLQFLTTENADELGLSGTEEFTILGIEKDLSVHKKLDVQAKKSSGELITFQVLARLDSSIEMEYYRHGGILQYVLRQFLEK